MSKIIALSSLALLALLGALLEGLVETVPPQFIQINGILIIFFTGVFALTMLRILFVEK